MSVRIDTSLKHFVSLANKNNEAGTSVTKDGI